MATREKVGSRMFITAIVNDGEWNDDTSTVKYSRFDNGINKYGMFELKNVKDIPMGMPYYVYLNVTFDFYTRTLNEIGHVTDLVERYEWQRSRTSPENVSYLEKFFTTNPRVLRDSKLGLVHWIIEQSTESDIHTDFDFETLKLGLNVKYSRQITYMCAAETRWGMNTDIIKKFEEYDINFTTSNILFYFGWKNLIDVDNIINDEYKYFIRNKSNDIFNKKILPYKAVCYNRDPRAHRLIILAHMRNKNHLSSTMYSLQHGASEYHYTALRPDLFWYLKDDLKYFGEGTPQISINLDEENINLGFNQANTYTWSHPLNSYLHIVTETVPNPYTYITEKSYKPFICMQPFIQFGGVDNVLALKKMGYETFDKWIDHSYDSIKDNHLRMAAFLKELDRLYAIPDAEWANMLYDMLGGLLGNVELANIPQAVNPLDDIMPILLRHYEQKY